MKGTGFKVISLLPVTKLAYSMIWHLFTKTVLIQYL
jgi:hypothetical protein